MFSITTTDPTSNPGAPLNGERPRQPSALSRASGAGADHAMQVWQHDTPQLIHTLCLRLVRHTELDFCAYYHLDPAMQTLCLSDSCGLSEETRHAVEQLPVTETLHRRAAPRGQRGEPAAAPAGGELEEAVSAALGATDFAAYLVVARGRLAGCLGAGKCRHKRLQDMERREISGAALQIALAVDHGLLAAEAAGLADRLAQMEQQRAELLAMLAHELRNPLGALSNAVHLMLSAGDDRPLFQRAGEIACRQLRHQGRLIDGLVDAARLEAGGITLQRELLDLGPLAREAAEEVRPAAELAGLHLHLELATAAFVMGDRTRLRQVLQNLLDNAIRFTPAGGRVTVRLSASPAKAAVELTVRDTGCGMEPRLLRALFQPLVQGDAGLVRRGGLGLGLAVARRLAELHGGSLRAESAGPGLGSTFIVTLPLSTPAAPS